MRIKYQSGGQALLATLLLAILLSGCAVGKTNSTPGSSTVPAVGATQPAGTTAAASTGTQPALPVTGATAVMQNPAKPVTVLETGSSLLYPLFNQWAGAIHQAYPNITVQTASTGSGTGIAQALAGVIQIGASDAYMSSAQLANSPGILNIPLAISAQQINYNLPGVKSLNLSGSDLAGIYTGKIQYWDDAALKADNPNANLPHQSIIPIHRSDGSGDTFLFTTYLSDTDSGWQSNYGYNTSINWPSVNGAIGAEGNAGMVQTLSQTPYSVGYVGISFLDQATQGGLGTAALQNKAGKFVLPTQQNISAAADAMVPNTPQDERVSLINAPGDSSYPIINYEYAIVNATQSSQDMATAVQTVLVWAIDPNGGNTGKFLDAVHFLPLPDNVRKISQAQIGKIHAG